MNALHHIDRIKGKKHTQGHEVPSEILPLAGWFLQQLLGLACEVCCILRRFYWRDNQGFWRSLSLEEHPESLLEAGDSCQCGLNKPQIGRAPRRGCTLLQISFQRNSSNLCFDIFYGIWSHHFMGNRWGNSIRLYFFGLQNHCRW